MIPAQPINIRCPQCGQSFTSDVQSIVDVGENPGLKDALLGGTLNVFTCPNCGARGRLGTPLLYQRVADMVAQWGSGLVGTCGLSSVGAVVGATHPRELTELRARMPGAQFYGPLGVGSHVDHLIAHTMLRQVFGAGVRFYEDLPYSIAASAYKARMAQLAGETLTPYAVAIDATLARKIEAIHAYASQLYELFGSAAQMEQQITDYAAGVAPAGARYGERVWQIG